MIADYRSPDANAQGTAERKRFNGGIPSTSCDKNTEAVSAGLLPQKRGTIAEEKPPLLHWSRHSLPCR
jgi:hypothetical protein